MSTDGFTFKGHAFRVAVDEDVPGLRRLVNEAYRELADAGLNYTGAYRCEQITRERLASGRAYLLIVEGRMAGTVLLRSKNLFTGRRTAYVSQLAVANDFKRRGLGSVLMDLAEHLAAREGYAGIQLDTAKPAGHLVAWYTARGYAIVGETRWKDKTYESWIFEKRLGHEPGAQVTETLGPLPVDAPLGL